MVTQASPSQYSIPGSELPQDAYDRLNASMVTHRVLNETESRDRTFCEKHGMDYADFARLPADVRQLVLRGEAASARPQLYDQQSIPIEAVMGLGGAEYSGKALPEGEFDRRMSALPEYDPRTHILMWRRPQMMDHPDGTRKLTHPDVNPVLLTDAELKFREGWRYEPEYARPPEPTYQCEIIAQGRRCEMVTVFPHDLENHMKHWHTEEYPILQAERNRKRADASDEETRRRATEESDRRVAAEERRAEEERRRSDKLEAVLLQIAGGQGLPPANIEALIAKAVQDALASRQDAPPAQAADVLTTPPDPLAPAREQSEIPAALPDDDEDDEDEEPEEDALPPAPRKTPDFRASATLPRRK